MVCDSYFLDFLFSSNLVYLYLVGKTTNFLNILLADVQLRYIFKDVHKDFSLESVTPASEAVLDLYVLLQ